jgi:predicted DNA-binding protein
VRESYRKKPGRPPAGPKGEKVSNYPQLTVRLPPETKARLNTLSLLTGTPIWQIIDRAIDAYVQHLPESERALLGSLADRIVRGDWPVVSHWNAMWNTPHLATKLPKSPAGAPAAAAKTAKPRRARRGDTPDRTK